MGGLIEVSSGGRTATALPIVVSSGWDWLRGSRERRLTGRRVAVELVAARLVSTPN
jgi:hypothetical protein